MYKLYLVILLELKVEHSIMHLYFFKLMAKYFFEEYLPSFI